MDMLNDALPIILYVLGAVLLIIFIIIGVKVITTMNKIDDVVKDVNQKVASLDHFFNIIDLTTDKLSFLSDRIVDGVSSFIINLFKKKKKKEEKIEEKEEEEIDE